jgi:hypothetical protein
VLVDSIDLPAIIAAVVTPLRLTPLRIKSPLILANLSSALRLRMYFRAKAASDLVPLDLPYFCAARCCGVFHGHEALHLETPECISPYWLITNSGFPSKHHKSVLPLCQCSLYSFHCNAHIGILSRISHAIKKMDYRNCDNSPPHARR